MIFNEHNLNIEWMSIQYAYEYGVFSIKIFIIWKLL